ncbi:MAG TPA: class I SAM-dependent RNA methyltransferase [Anaerolineaceae bacterium]
MNDLLELQITGMAFGGEAMARRADGRVVFVAGCLPGERVLAQVIEEKRGFVRASLVEILDPSPERILPKCKHFGVCGGCHYQFLAYQRQCEIKRQILIDQLSRIANIQNPPVKPLQPAPNEWHYRNTVQFHLSSDGKVGYQKAGSNEVVAIQECYLPEPPLDELWKMLDLDAIPGLQRISLKIGSAQNLMVVLEGTDPTPPEFSVDIPLSCVYHSPAGEVVLAGDPALMMEVNHRKFQVSAGSFFQVNTAQAGAMVRYLLQRLPLTRRMTLLDVYCGVGLFSAFLAEKVEHCIGIEVSPSACEDFTFNLDRYDHVDLYQGKAEDILPNLAIRADVVLVDPPRAGIEVAARRAIERLNPAMIAYISCDPATLSRDARGFLAYGYHLVEVVPFDLFPQTYHLESISFFER